MQTNLALKEIPSLLRSRDESLDVKYVYDTTTASYELSQIYNDQIEEDLNLYQIVDLSSLKVAFTDDIKAMQQRVYFYRSTALLLLILFILIPAVALYFYQDNLRILTGGVIYTLLAFFLVESYNQALLNKFQHQLKNHLQLEQIVAAKSIPFDSAEIDTNVSPAVVHKNPYSPIEISRFHQGTINEIRFILTDKGIEPTATVTEELHKSMKQLK
jgi:hypothetical protein